MSCRELVVVQPFWSRILLASHASLAIRSASSLALLFDQRVSRVWPSPPEDTTAFMKKPSNGDKRSSKPRVLLKLACSSVRARVANQYPERSIYASTRFSVSFGAPSTRYSLVSNFATRARKPISILPLAASSTSYAPPAPPPPPKRCYCPRDRPPATETMPTGQTDLLSSSDKPYDKHPRSSLSTLTPTVNSAIGRASAHLYTTMLGVVASIHWDAERTCSRKLDHDSSRRR